MAFDSCGNLFVADAATTWCTCSRRQAPTPSEPLRPATTPTATLTGVSDPSALAFDSSGNLYVASSVTGNGVSPVSVFAPGTFPDMGLSGPPEADALAFDASGQPLRD